MVFNYFKIKFVEKDKKRKKDNFNIGQVFSLYGSLHEFNSLGKKNIYICLCNSAQHVPTSEIFCSENSVSKISETHCLNMWILLILYLK